MQKSIQLRQTADFGRTRPHVAVIDDDPSVADAMAAIIDSQGWRSTVYLRGEDFLEDLDTEDPPDCALLDLYMPGISGVDVLWRLADRETAIPVIALTARPEGPLSAPAIEAGAFALMTKPVRPEKLLSRITEVMGEL